MTLNGVVLGGVSLAAARELPRLPPRALDLPLGLASAGVLYVVFTIGDHVARRVMPNGATDIDEIYRLREQRPAAEIAARLVAVIGPAEELFWRGLLQSVLMRRIGRWRGAAAATGAYAAVHLASGNLTLTGAAGTAGAFWSGLRSAGMPLPALVVSHVAWDIWIFLVAPTSSARAATSRG